MPLPAGFLDELRARTPMPALVSRRVKLARSGRQWKGCCPFHGEKTPSFYVYEDSFHCFGCGAHGDAISFVMQTQGSSFIEAVGALAAEAGLEVPKPSREAAEQERRRLDLHEVLEAAGTFFRERLRAPEGEAARAYLERRGLTAATIEGFGVGWSGDGRGGLAAALAGQGIGPERLLEAGLLRQSEHGPPRDLFYGRVMFPIRDRSGRLVSFGGRILGEGQPKYVNGPETPVFSKRRTLYGLDRAREAARNGGAVVAVEGYMDVIALHQAGFGAAVAPLGTALTAEQLEALWRLAPTPVLCFDGDAAGGRAAARAAAVALLLLAPERSLRIATLPPGEDPDTLVRARGQAGFQAVLDAAMPLADALFALLRQGAGETPEDRAAFLARLDAAAAQIPDRGLASEIRAALRDRFYAARQARRAATARPAGGARSPERRGAAVRVLSTPRQPPDHALAEAERLRTLTAIVLRHPELARDVEEAWCTLHLPPALHGLRHAVLAWTEHGGVDDPARHGTDNPPRLDPAMHLLDSPTLLAHLTQLGLAEEVATVLAPTPCPLPACTLAGAMPAEAEAGWWHFFGLMQPGRLEEEVAAARRAFEARPDVASQRRIIALCTAWEALRHGEQGVEAEA